jgi:hypothetical protein
MRVALHVLAVLALGSAPVHAQASGAYVPLGADSSAAGLDRVVSLSITAPVRDVVARIAALANLSIVFDDSLPGLRASVTLRVRDLPAREALARSLAGTSLQALVSRSGQVILVAAPVRPSRTARVTGAIRDLESGQMLDGARIELLGSRFTSYSRDSGRFVLGPVPAGAYTLRVSRLGYEPVVRALLHVPADVQEPLELSMRRATLSLAEIIVTPGYFGLLQSSLAAPQSLSREQLETIPQIGEDIYRAVSRLPGVSADDFSAKFSVRGGSGDELYVSLDGLELVEPFHLKDVGGAFSIIDIQALGNASLTTGGFGAEYGDRLTGVFTLNTTDPRTDRVHTSLGVSVMNARATVQGGFAGGKGGWLVSARPGYLDVALKFTEVRDSIKPRYYDLFAKAQYDLGRGGQIAIHALHANDSFRYLQSDEPNIFSNYRSSYAWLTWNEKLGSRVRVASVASVGALGWRRNGDQFDKSVEVARIRDDRSLHRVAIRQDWTADLSPSVMLKWGFDAKRESVSYDYFSAVSIQARDGVDSDAIDTTMSIASPRSDKTAFYLAPRIQLLPSLTLEVGVRHDRNSMLGEAITSPRVNVSWQPASATTMRAAWGGYSQSQQLFGLQAQDGVTTFERAQRAEQRILGIEQVLPLGLTARIEAYERRVTSPRSEFVNVSGDVLLFPELSWDRLRIDRTGGRDRGLELQLSRSNGGRMDWSASYARATSVDSVGGREVPRAFDQKHAVHLDWSLRPASNAWRLSVGGIWHSGWPYTPTVLTVDTLANTATRFSVRSTRRPGELNSERLRSYHRIDARWTRYFDTSHGRLSMFGEVYNLLNTENLRGVFKTLVVRGRGVVVGTEEIMQWPRLPMVGMTWEF